MANVSASANIEELIQEQVIQAMDQLYGQAIAPNMVNISPTRREFQGDFTVVVFPLAKSLKKNPQEVAESLGTYLVENTEELTAYNVIKGFLNLVVSDAYWTQFLDYVTTHPDFGQHPKRDEKVMVEFSSPNTNKPLHLGHIRNILLGWATSRIYEAAGYEVVRVQIINDRGIAICKSMLAWQKFGEGATPQSTGIKSDHFVGKYYVLFEQKFQEEYKAWQQTDAAQEIYETQKKGDQTREAFFKVYKNTYFNEQSQLGAEAKAMLLAWEDSDPEVIELWKQMNGWVYAGFDATYERLQVSFDELYYESDTYLLGKDTIKRGLEEGIFYRKPDGSVWIDLDDAKLDHKLVLRSDGTSVYMTQDIGTAQLRYRDHRVDRMIYVVADEQNYHFKVLFEILKRLGEPYADGLYHLSYGMVDLPTGKMKSREGTVVDADDLIAEVTEEARKNSQERGTLTELPPEAQEAIIQQIGLAALKFFIIKVQPRKRMTFDPKESVDLQGQTGPYIQNAYVRIQSILRKAAQQDPPADPKAYGPLEEQERKLLGMVYQFPQQIEEAAANYDPSVIANFCYNLAKAYHRYYHDHAILKAESEAARAFRLQLSTAVAQVLRFGMDLLGIELPNRM